jgi:hypothetical protein
VKGTEPEIATCAECAEFVDDAAELEALFVGLTALSSAYGSTRGRAGVCRVNDTFQDPSPACPAFVRRGRAGSDGERPDAVTSDSTPHGGPVEEGT